MNFCGRCMARLQCLIIKSQREPMFVRITDQSETKVGAKIEDPRFSLQLNLCLCMET